MSDPQKQKTFAPPTQEELSLIKKASTFAPPSQEELAGMQTAEPESIHPLTSGVLGAGQGITLGFGDEIGGMAKALVDRLSIGNRLQPKTSLQEDYRARQQEIEQYLNRAERENPKSYVGGNIVGGVATMAVPGLNALAPVKGASAAANIGRLATAGALAGAGSSKGNIDSYKGVRSLAADALKGGAIGGVTGAAFEGAGKVFGKYLNPEELRKFANEKAVKAAGALGKDMTKLGREKVQQTGAELLKNKIVTPLSSLDDIAERSETLRKTSGEAIGSAINKIDDNVKSVVRTVGESELSQDQINALANKLGVEADKASVIDAILNKFQFNNQKVAQRIEEELILPNAGDYTIKNELQKLQTLVDDARSTGIKPLSFGQAVKSNQGRQTSFQSDTVPAAFRQDVYRIIASELDDSVKKTGDLMSIAQGGTSEAAEALNKAALEGYQSAKSTYGATKTAQKLAERGLGREAGNRQFSLTDYLAGIAGGNVAGPIAAPAMGAANKLARKYGASLQATGASKLADIIDSNPNTLKPLFGLGHDVSTSGKAAVSTEKILQELLDQRGRR